MLALVFVAAEGWQQSEGNGRFEAGKMRRVDSVQATLTCWRVELAERRSMVPALRLGQGGARE